MYSFRDHVVKQVHVLIVTNVSPFYARILKSLNALSSWCRSASHRSFSDHKKTVNELCSLTVLTI